MQKVASVPRHGERMDHAMYTCFKVGGRYPFLEANGEYNFPHAEIYTRERFSDAIACA